VSQSGGPPEGTGPAWPDSGVRYHHHAEDAQGQGDQFMAIKAFLGALFEPTDYKHHPDNSKLPDSNLEIEWVHGYR
jgi:hypothetical protein